MKCSLPALGFCYMLTPGVRGAPALRVRSSPHFAQVRSHPTPRGTEISGRLTDEVDAPLSGHLITADAGNLPLEACAPRSDRTDSAGAFCFFVPSQLAALRQRVTFKGNSFLDPASSTVERSLPTALEATLQLPKRTFLLGNDLGSAEVTLRYQDSHAPDPEGEEPQLLSLKLEAEHRPPLVLPGPKQIRVGETVNFSLAAIAGVAPGPARLVATIEEAPNFELTRASQSIQLVAPVEMKWITLPPTIQRAVPFGVSVSVTGPHAPLNEGWIELSIGAQVVALSPVQADVASLLPELEGVREPSVLLRARYVPATPNYQPTRELEATLSVGSPPLWRHVPWVAIALTSAWWITRGWHRPRRRTVPGTESAPAVTSGIQVVKQTRTQSGWNGLVTDPHTQAPVPAATLELVVPSLTRGSVIAVTNTDAGGGFVLHGPGSLPEGTRLVVSAPGYSTWSERVPPHGELRVALVQRRRRLLETLVRWSERRGRPWRQPADATPGAVARTAEQQGDSEASRWAARLEQAAFGDAVPSAELETQLVGETPAERSNDVGR